MYVSKEENVSITYPSDWTVKQPTSGSATKDSTDAASLVSPSGAVTLTWVPSLAGFGNDHDDQYPLNTVIDKSPISGASGFYVVSGITTLDSKIFYPWIAVQDSDGILTSGVQGDVLAFEARHALNDSTGKAAYAMLSTSGLRANIGSIALTQQQATSWFSGAEVQQAKQILLSINYAN